MSALTLDARTTILGSWCLPSLAACASAPRRVCLPVARSRRRRDRYLASAWPAAGRGWGWRAAFVAGLVTAGALAPIVAPGAIAGPSASWPLAIAGGLLVGFGARYGGGCTSGHGVCGVGRLSRRSIVGSATFMVVAMIVVFVARYGGGS